MVDLVEGLEELRVMAETNDSLVAQLGILVEKLPGEVLKLVEERDALRAESGIVADVVLGQDKELATLRAELAEADTRKNVTALQNANLITALRARLRDTCQILVEEVGADGPCDAEDAARKAIENLTTLRASLATDRAAYDRLLQETVHHDHEVEDLQTDLATARALLREAATFAFGTTWQQWSEWVEKARAEMLSEDNWCESLDHGHPEGCPHCGGLPL